MFEGRWWKPDGQVSVGDRDFRQRSCLRLPSPSILLCRRRRCRRRRRRPRVVVGVRRCRRRRRRRRRYVGYGGASLQTLEGWWADSSVGDGGGGGSGSGNGGGGGGDNGGGNGGDVAGVGMRTPRNDYSLVLRQG